MGDFIMKLEKTNNLNDEKAYDGKLTEKELKNLVEAKFSKKEIKFIENSICKLHTHLSSFSDLIGDNKAPSRLFLYNLKHFGYLLEDDPKKVIDKKGVLIRKYLVGQIIKRLGPLFLSSKQIFENRKDLLYGKKEKDNKITVPKEPVIWAPNHHFKDDALATIIAEKRPSYMVFGSLPEFYNTINGLLVYLEGALIINRKVQSSRNAIGFKIDRAISLGADVFYCPEGVLDKYTNKNILDL